MATEILHGGTEQLPFAAYLARVLLHLLVFGLVAAGMYWLLGVLEGLFERPVEGRDR